MSKEQKRLKKAHGTPSEFAKACWACPDISGTEAQAAVRKYEMEWHNAGLPKRK